MPDEPRDRVDDASAGGLLDAHLPHWAASGLAWMLLLLFGLAAVVSVVVRIPESVSSPFVLVPVRGTDPVRVPRSGTLAELRVADGQAVTRGQVLFVIRSGSVGDQAAELKSLETQLAGHRESLANARQQFESQRRAHEEESRGLAAKQEHLAQRVENHRGVRLIRETRFQASRHIAETEVESARSEVAFKKQHLALAREVADRYQRGHEGGFLSWSEYTTARIEASRLAVDLEQIERQLAVAQLKLRQLRADRDAEETEWRVTMQQLEAEQAAVRSAADRLRHDAAARAAEFRELERRLREETEKAQARVAALTPALVHTRGSDLSVLAPCTGSVLRLSVRAPGAEVRDGEPLGELACAGERLQAELTLPASGVARLRPGLPVRLLYDAFPYERFGVRHGTLRWVSPAALGAKEGGTFRALADVQDEAITVDGQRRTLLAGMGGRAEVVVGRQTLLGHVLAPLRQLREHLSDGSAR